MGSMSVPPHFVEISDTKRFHGALSKAAMSQPQGAAVDVPDNHEEFTNHRMFITPDSKAGYAVSPHGELTAVFKHKGAPYQDVAEHAAKHGGLLGGARWLTAFDDPSHKLAGAYSAGRFRVSGRIRFDPSQAPENWNREDTPDVLIMSRDMNKKNTDFSPTSGAYMEGENSYGEGVTKAMRDSVRAKSRKSTEVAKFRREMGGN